MKINKKIAISCGAGALVLVCTAIFILPKNVNAEPPRRREYPVKKDSIIVGIDSSGSISSKKQNHYLETSLQIDNYEVLVGDNVKKGDILARLSKEDVLQKKQTAEDKLRTEQANLAKQNAEKQTFRQGIDKQIYDLRLAGENAYNANANQFITKRAAADQSIKDKLAATTQSKDKISRYESEKANRSNKITSLNGEIAGLQAENMFLQQEIDRLLADTSTDNSQEIVSLNQKKINNEMLVADKQREKISIETTDYDALIAAENQLISQNDAEIVKLNAEVTSANNNIAYYEDQRNKDREKENKAVDQIEQQAKAQLSVLDSLIGTAKTAVGNAQKELNEIKKYAESLVITAQCDGVVTKLGYSAKAVTDKTTSVAEIGIDNEKTLLLQIDPTEIAEIEEGQEVSFYVDAYPDATFNGTVKSKSFLQNSNSKFDVIVAFEQNDQPLLDGMGANATLIIKQKLNVITVSNKAIFLENNKSYVNILDEKNNLQKKEIKTGFSNGRITEVIEGLADGETVWVEERYEN